MKTVAYLAGLCLLATPALAGSGYFSGYNASSGQSRGNYLSDYGGHSQSRGNYLSNYSSGSFGPARGSRPSVPSKVVIHRKHNYPTPKKAAPKPHVVRYAPGQKLYNIGPSGNYARSNFVPAAPGSLGIIQK